MTDPMDDDALEVAALADSDVLEWHTRLWAAREHAPNLTGPVGELVRTVLYSYDHGLSAAHRGDVTPNELSRWEDALTALVQVVEAYRAGEQL